MSLSPQRASASTASSNQLMNNYTGALTETVPERRASAPVFTWSSPDSHPSNSFVVDEELLLGEEDLMLPTAAISGDACGSGSTSTKLADATVVTFSTSEIGLTIDQPPSIITTSTGHKSSVTQERRHSLPSSVILSADSKIGNALTQPVPEFLCHLFTMLRDENLRDVISWQVPTQDETDTMGGGIKGIGKIVCHQPGTLQESILGKYYRHSKYASFQRQLNYFGFKKRLHGGKKGKLSPCSYVHEGLCSNVESLLGLKRRPPVKKRVSMDLGESNSVSSMDDETEKIVERSKKRRSCPKGKFNKKEKTIQDGGMNLSSKRNEPFAVKAGDYDLAWKVNNNVSFAALRPVQVPSISQQTVVTNPAPASVTLAQLLSTTLPPTEVLFDDDFGVELNNSAVGNGFYVNDQGKCFSQNSLVDLAMFY